MRARQTLQIELVQHFGTMSDQPGENPSERQPAGRHNRGTHAARLPNEGEPPTKVTNENEQ